MRIQNKKMRKVQKPTPQTTFLPTIIQCSSRRDLKNTQRKISKENLHPNRERPKKIAFQTTQLFLSKKNQFKDQGLNLDQYLELKVLETEKTDIGTKPKICKPWVAKQIDMNKETTKTNRLQSIHKKENQTNQLRRKSCQNQKQNREDGQNLVQKTITRHKCLELENSKITKGITKRIVSITREKIYSCRIAMKNSMFPIDQKKYQQAKLADFFEKDQQLSTINKRQEGDEEDLFITFDTLNSMNL